jgi:hypothetical protein
MSREAVLARRELWKRRVQEFEQGTADVTEFCHRAGVSTASFYQWRKRLKPASPPPAKPPNPSAKAARPRKSTTNMKFLPVELLGPQNVEVQFPCGARVLVPSHDHDAIRTVLQSLVPSRREEPAC